MNKLLFELMSAHELALVHELSELMAVHEQPKFEKTGEQWEFMNRISSWTHEFSFVVQK